MSVSMEVLLGYIALTMGLVVAVVLYRTGLVFFRGQPANSWTRGAQSVSDPGLVTRLAHAHMNCVENLPLVAAVLLAAQVMGKGSVTDPLACWLLMARLGQALVHVIGVNHWLVMIRATLYTVQMGIVGYWVAALAGLI